MTELDHIAARLSLSLIDADLIRGASPGHPLYYYDHEKERGLPVLRGYKVTDIRTPFSSVRDKVTSVFIDRKAVHWGLTWYTSNAEELADTFVDNIDEYNVFARRMEAETVTVTQTTYIQAEE